MAAVACGSLAILRHFLRGAVGSSDHAGKPSSSESRANWPAQCLEGL
jgi:hypothetical protein